MKLYLFVLSLFSIPFGNGQIIQYFDSINQVLYLVEDKDTIFDSGYSLTFTNDYKLAFTNDSTQVAFVSFERLHSGTGFYDYSVSVSVFNFSPNQKKLNFNFKFGERPNKNYVLYNGISLVLDKSFNWITNLKELDKSDLVEFIEILKNDLDNASHSTK